MNLPAPPPTTHSPSERDSHQNLALAFLTVFFLAAALLPVNTVFTVLKETPIFWHNLGGYPVALRELVLVTYYPLLTLNFILCASATVLVQKKSALTSRLSINSLSMLLLFWSAWSLNIGLLLANNIQNLMEGRPFHFHPANDWVP